MEYTCCLCGRLKNDYGNNPAPLKPNNLKCCDDCNENIVIPARVQAFKEKGDYKER